METLSPIRRKNTNPFLVDCDERPYAQIKIFNKIVSCLLDSGSNRSIAGNSGVRLLLSIGLNLKKSNNNNLIKTADKSQHLIEGVFIVPITFNNAFSLIEIYAVPTLPQSFILGVDFFRKFNVSINAPGFIWSCNVLDNVEVGARIIDWQSLNNDQIHMIEQLKARFREIGDGRLGRTRLITHDIETGDAMPIIQRHYPLSPAMLQHLYKELDRMISLDVVEESTSNWCSPIVMVKKSNGKFRLCIDSRKLNAVTKRCAYPLPFISSILDRLGKTKFLSSIDLKDAFWQIPLTDASKEKTAFVVPGRGLFQFKVLPFGLHNSAASMQKLMNSLFGYDTEEKIFAYLDDLIIATESFEEHCRLLQHVLDKLKMANLTVNFDKCKFCRPELKYLGFVVDRNGLRTDPEKVNTILNFPKPRTFTDMKRFLGLVSWYRRFVENFAGIAAPLHDLTANGKKHKTIKWTIQGEESFEKLKVALISAPILTPPDFTKTFIIHCDASNTAIGAVISQLVSTEGNDEKPVAYASRKLRGAEVNYHTGEKECLAIVFAIEKFRPYIEGYKFKICTDHAPLLWLFRQQNLTGRLARWVMKLQQYDFEMVFKKGRENVVADALSRIPEVNLVSFEVTPADFWYLNMMDKVESCPIRYKNWKIIAGKLFTKFDVDSKHGRDRPWKLVVPSSARNAVLKECHDDPMSGHFGVYKTKHRVLARYYWPGVPIDVSKYVKACQICSCSKPSNAKTAGEMGKFKSASRPWQMISIDLMGPFPRSTKGNAYLLVVCDWFTKFPCLFPIREATSKKVVQILENHIFLEYGVPEIVIADNGKQFTSHDFKALIDRYNVPKLWFNARYHPQNNYTENTNKIIGTALRSYISDNHRVWDKEIPKITVALRSAIHSVTGYSPFFLNYGREFVFSGSDHVAYRNLNPNEEKDGSNIGLDSRCGILEEFNQISEDVSYRMYKAYLKNKKYYDSNKIKLSYNVGDIVYKRNYVNSSAIDNFSAKLAPRFVRCVVKSKVSDLIYVLADETGKEMGVWHIKDIKGV